MEKIDRIIGAKEYLKWKNGRKLTMKQSILVNCYTCNGEEEGGIDCKCEDSCPMYPYFAYKSRKKRKN